MIGKYKTVIKKMEKNIRLKITVLLSSYNGEKFIREQLDSILEQDVQNIAELEILVRDDGSKDSTHDILNEYKSKGLLTWYTGENLRPAKSFWHLVNKCNNSDFYAFCDQDDVWKKDKLSRAIKLLREKEEDVPLLYCSSVTVVDAKLNKIGELGCQNRTSDDFAQSLIYSIAPGCTFVFNNSARKELLKYDIEKNYTLIHDWLAHKIVAMKGKIIFDDYQSMLYRQHGNNQIGSEKKGIKSFIKKIKRFLHGDSTGVRSEVAQALLSVYGEELDKESKTYNYLYIVANYKRDRQIKKLFLNEEAFYTKTKNDKFLRILIRMNKV